MVIVIKYFWLIKLFRLTELILHQLVQLSLFVDLFFNNFNLINSENLLVSLSIDLNYTKSKSFNNNYCKSNGIRRKKIGKKKVEKDDLKDFK